MPYRKRRRLDRQKAFTTKGGKQSRRKARARASPKTMSGKHEGRRFMSTCKRIWNKSGSLVRFAILVAQLVNLIKVDIHK